MSRFIGTELKNRFFSTTRPESWSTRPVYVQPRNHGLNGGTAGLGPYGSYLNSLAAYLVGATDQTSRTYQTVTPTNRQTQVAGYLQDTYQVTSKLTLDLGLRYDFYSPITPRYKGGASNYDPVTNTLLIAGYGDVDLAHRSQFAINCPTTCRVCLSYRREVRCSRWIRQ